jgi:hypothetical protein
MSHGASACFADVISPTNVCVVYPVLEPLFKEVIGHEVWGLLELTQNVDYEKLADIQNELSDVVPQEEDETDANWEKRVARMAKSFRQAYRKLQMMFYALTGAEIGTQYLDEDCLDGYAEVKGRFWFTHDHQQLKPKVAKSVRKGLVINRRFYAVYG